MAMQGASNPAYDVSRLGQTNLAGDVRDLFLKLYAGEILTSFEAKNVMMPLIRTRTITKGKSASFPMLGRTTAEYHTPGNEITGGQVRASERIVTIDDLLISSQFITNIDEAINHYDVRSTYSKEAGIALATEADKNILRTALKAALSTNATRAAALVQDYKAFTEEDFTDNITIGSGNAADIIDPAKIAKSIFDAKKEFDKKNVGYESGAVVVLPPDQYYALLDVTDGNKLTYMNRDFGGNGSVASGVVPSIAGMPVVMSNHLVTADLIETGSTNKGQSKGNRPLANTAGSGRTTAYDITNVTTDGVNLVDLAAKVRGLIMTRDAVATVKLMDLGVESEYQINRQGTLMVAKYAMGHNVLRPACAIALMTA